MKTIYETILGSTRSGKASIIQSVKTIFNERPNEDNLKNLEELWKMLDLGIKGAHWKISGGEFFYSKDKINLLRVNFNRKEILIGKQNFKDESLINKIEDTLSLKMIFNKQYNAYIL